MVSTLRRCSYVNLTISSVNKLSLSCFSLFSLFCFSSLCQIVVLLNFLDIKVDPNSLLFSQRERERERERERDRRRSPVVRGGGDPVVAWC